MKRPFSVVVAALLGIGVPLTGVITAHAANKPATCATLDTVLSTAANADVITLGGGALCSGAHTIPTGVQITLQGATAQDGFDGGGTNQILKGTDNGFTVIQNLVFQNGHSTGNANGGGAIHLGGSVSPTITNNSFFGNTADLAGALDIQGTAANPTVITHNTFGAAGKGNVSSSIAGALFASSGGNKVVSDNTFDSNRAAFTAGAAFITNFTPAARTIDLERNVVTNNAIGQGSGGGVFIENNGNVTVIANVFRGNNIGVTANSGGNHGGGLYVLTAVNGQTTTQAHNLFDSNTVATASIADSSFNLDFGGGGEFVFTSTVTSLDDTFINNSVGDAGSNTTPVGGGLGMQGETGNKATLNATNLVATNNRVGALGEGGGIYAGFSQFCSQKPCFAEVDLFDSTVDGNSVGRSGKGPGLSGDTSDIAKVTNSIVSGNTGGVKQVDGFGTIALNHTDSCETASAAYSGAGNLCTDPKLKNVPANDVHETAASPTIDAGDTTKVPSGLTSDYQGDGRVLGARVDMGADEVVPAAAVIPTLPRAGRPPTGSAPLGVILLWTLLAAALALVAATRRRRPDGGLD